MKGNRLGYLIKEGFKSIFTHGFMSFASVTIIVACLIIMGSFSLVSVNIDSIIKEIEANNQILAFVDKDLTDDEARAIQTRLEAIDNVKSVEFVTREEAMENFVAQYDDETMFNDLTSDALRNRYVIYMDDIALMESTYADVEAVSGIDDVSAQLEVSHYFITIRNVISVISMILIVILLVVSVFIMSNTVKLATFSRKEEIAIMKMVGAGNGFIRCPFVIEGLVLGIFGGGVAFFIQWGIYTLICDKVMGSILGSIVTIIPFSVLMYPVLAVFIAVGLLVGVFGSNIAIKNYLKV